MRWVPELAALAATLLADLAALAVTAATAGRLMAASRLVAMAALEFWLVMAATPAATAARRAEDMAGPEELAAVVATGVSLVLTLRSAALAAMPVLPDPTRLVSKLLADLAALAVTAATVGRLMAAQRLVAMAALEFWSVLVTTSLTPASGKGS